MAAENFGNNHAFHIPVDIICITEKPADHDRSTIVPGIRCWAFFFYIYRCCKRMHSLFFQYFLQAGLAFCAAVLGLPFFQSAEELFIDKVALCLSRNIAIQE